MQSNRRVNNPDIIKPQLKSFLPTFYKKERVDFPAIRTSRTTNLDITTTLTQKFFAYFFSKK